MDVAGSIVGGAMAITDAIQTLIRYATILQKENVEAGRFVSLFTFLYVLTCA